MLAICITGSLFASEKVPIHSCQTETMTSAPFVASIHDLCAENVAAEMKCHNILHCQLVLALLVHHASNLQPG